MSSILVTGGSGFIGKHLVPQLQLDGHEVFPVNTLAGDIADEATWQRFPRADLLIHLAARSFVPESWNHPAEYMRTNLLGTMHALEFCRRHRTGMVFFSSYMYGKPSALPIAESAPIIANNPYALSKMLAEDACTFYENNFGINLSVIRPFNVYGAGQSAAFLVPSIIEQARAGVTIHVKDLEPRRDYIYVKDLVDAVRAVVNCAPTSGTYNIGSGVSHSVADLIASIQTVLGTELPVHSTNERRAGEVMDTVADITLARARLGWSPSFTLRDGLADMLVNP
ncbi:MAG: NAD-dependent epimerase/dehydratase family protein [Betaproteobacteria bacterium]|nr:NAD-dependent epimerase/dehydratase family protein [Betaproteobacteria bacterium]